MSKPILSIAVPTFNMEKWLAKNLATYMDERLRGRLEVICLNNASEDSSPEIIRDFVEKCPDIFVMEDRDSRGYGGSINAAMARARGEYFRIVDADDWVDTGELVKLVDALESCGADVVVTDYQIVNMQNGEMTPVRACDRGAEYGRVYEDCAVCAEVLPSIHSTTYRTELLHECGFYMQDGIFFVDEEYVILPYLRVKTALCLPFDVYRYQVANPAQSTSPKNRAKLREHRAMILRRLIGEFRAAVEAGAEPQALDYCRKRIALGVGDHFTTLLMYVEDRALGRREAADWAEWLKTGGAEFLSFSRKKYRILKILNRLGLGLDGYARLKAVILPGGKQWQTAKAPK